MKTRNTMLRKSRIIIRLLLAIVILLAVMLESGCAAHRRLGQVPCPCESK